MRKIAKFKSGVTSIYVVAFTTLLISVITVAFIALIVSENTQTVEAKLAQSAYDSALAGVEDAKLAIIAYHNCVGHDSDNVVFGDVSPEKPAVSCANIKKYMNEHKDNCNVTAWILGRLDGESGKEGEVLIQETSSGTIASSETTQAYTCVTINEVLSDYRSYLSSDTMLRVVPLKTDQIDKLTGVRVSWYSDIYGKKYVYSNVNSEGSVSFKSLNDKNGAATPPTISVQLIQTDSTFDLNSFDTINGSETNRGTLFLVPSNKENATINKTNPVLSAQNGFINSNNKTTTNEGITVFCDPNGDNEFACSASLQLPKPIQKTDNENDPDNNTLRSPEFSFLIISLPYGQPTTDFSVELCVDKNGDCELDKTQDAGLDSPIALFDGVQALVDSTGRANDVYSRVDARVELADVYFPYPENALQLNGQEGTAIDKNFWTTTTNCKYTIDTGEMKECASAGNAG